MRRDWFILEAMENRLCLLSVHAHPDDESSKGAGTVAKYHAEGVHTVLVCATDGAEGDILNPAMESDEVRHNIIAVRQQELAEATKIIGYDEVVMLGYRDSGMPDSEANKHDECFAQADFREAVGRLVAIIRRCRPHVILTYGDDQRGYPHPDHLRVHDISVAAFEAAADPDAHPWAGEPWQPLKMYYSVWSRKRIAALHEKFIELGLESPFSEDWFKGRPSQDERVTTSIDIEGFADVRLNALLAHRTQVDPNSKFWFGLPPEVQREIHPYEDYIRARSLVEADVPETDLFDGIRERVQMG
jgi:mycothiol S-conjugate amidase